MGGDDSLGALNDVPNLRVDGGDGNDRIAGGHLNDTLVGGADPEAQSLGTFPATVPIDLSSVGVLHSFELTFAADLPPARYALLAKVDSISAIAETNETNNAPRPSPRRLALHHRSPCEAQAALPIDPAVTEH